MERTARTFEVTIETSETLVVNRRRKTVVVWCSTCERHARMLAPEDAAAVADFSPRDPYRLVENGRVHFTEQPSGELLICIDSLKEVLL